MSNCHWSVKGIDKIKKESKTPKLKENVFTEDELKKAWEDINEYLSRCQK